MELKGCLGHSAGCSKIGTELAETAKEDGNYKETGDVSQIPQFKENLDSLQKDGYLHIRNALEPKTVAKWKEVLYEKYEKKEYCGANSVGNVYFDKLLGQVTDMVMPLLTLPESTTYLRAILGKQCQLRSVRAHVNPASYKQEWHMDFSDYYYQEGKSNALNPTKALCMNQTFYLTDNEPGVARLTFLKGYLKKPIPDELLPHIGYTDDRKNVFQVWCDNQEHVNLHPKAGDAVVFYSHIPHQGAKIREAVPGEEIRANLVFHFQQTPMFPGIMFVSDPQFTLDTLGYRGSFPFV